VSKVRKSSYPERPAGGHRPPKPGEARKRPSSEHIHGRRNVWKEQAEAPASGPRPVYDKVDTKLSIIGHMNKALDRFMKHNRYNRVSLRNWGGRTRTEV